MDDTERLAEIYLSSLGLSPIVFEPEGTKKPPDFLAGARIAVEVRRLNHNVVTKSGAPHGLETTRIALERAMREVLKSLGPSKEGKSWFVHYTFSRPLPKLPKLKQEVRNVLAAFRDGQIVERELAIADHFKVHLFPTSKVFSNCFVLGGFVDRDTTCYLISELEKNVRICIQEKSKKIANIKTKYSEWWLILIDQIGYGTRE
jgi:hypothetical protein